jgi:hypothetical protein
MADERPTESAVPTPIAWEPPETEEQLRAEEREVREHANSEAALRGASIVGALGGNVPTGSGALIGQGGALGIQETQREEGLDPRRPLADEERPRDAADTDDRS